MTFEGHRPFRRDHEIGDGAQLSLAERMAGIVRQEEGAVRPNAPAGRETGIASEIDTRILFASHSPQLIQRLLGDPEAALLWMNDGAEVAVDDTRRPAIPLLMTLGALSAGAEAFDPARKTILLTEDKDSGPARTLARVNGASDNLAVLSYNGCGNLKSKIHHQAGGSTQAVNAKILSASPSLISAAWQAAFADPTEPAEQVAA